MRYLRKDSRITFSEPRTKACLLASFFMPILILLVIAYKFKLYPFSSNCFATEALRNTYFPVVSELRRKILARESLFYSWNAGGGVNFWAWISAYASSPFVLLYLLFSEDSIAEVTQILFALKAASASLSLFLLLWKKENVVSPVSVGIATAYGLCGYVLTYSQEPWMLDAVILLPLLILTLHSLIQGKKAWAFSVAVALTGITCAKAGIYLLIFVCAMMPLVYIEDRKENKNYRKVGTVLKDFFLYLCFGAGLSAFVWYPACQALWKTVPGSQVIHIPQDLTMDLKAWDILDRACFDSLLIFPSFETQSPSVYCGIVPIILTILYGFSSRIRFTEKVYCFTTMVVLYISMSSKIVRYVFLGLHFPITGVYPQSILITFLIVYMSGRLLSRGVWFEERSHVHAALGFLITFMLIRSAIAKDLSYSDYAVYMAVFFLIIYFAIILNSNSVEGKRKEAVLSLLALTMFLEAGLSFYRPIKEKYYHETVEKNVVEKNALDGLRIDPSADPRAAKEKKKKTYALDESVLYGEQNQDEQTKAQQAANGLSAAERVFVPSPSDNNYNYGFRYHFATLASDGYMTSKKFAGSLHAIGINRNTEATKILPGYGTPVTDALLYQGRLVEESSGIGSVRSISNAGANGFFFVSEDIYGELFTEDSPFANQNALAFRLTGSRPFTILNMEADVMDNMKESSDGVYTAIDSESAASVVFESEEILGEEDSSIYIYYSCENSVTVEAYLKDDDNEVPLNLSSRKSDECIRIDLPHPQGWRLSVRLSVYSPKDAHLRFYAAIPDQTELNLFETALRSSAWNMSSFEAGSFSGAVDAPEAGTLLFSVPADAGWTATIDGQKTDVFTAYRTFAAVHVPQGHHEISLHFVPEGLKEGAIAGSGSAVLLILLSVSKLFPKKKKEEEKIEVPQEEEDKTK